eukprot:5899936-Pleurochrysis_carterae.AAC.3
MAATHSLRSLSLSAMKKKLRSGTCTADQGVETVGRYVSEWVRYVADHNAAPSMSQYRTRDLRMKVSRRSPTLTSPVSRTAGQCKSPVLRHLCY